MHALHDQGLHARAVQAAIEAMGGTVLMARALVESGRRVDLEGLDRDATALCAAVLGLSGGQGRLLRPALEQLLRQVDALLAEVARN
jgi:class 3 adenylate cyclase